jgi:hypothetical protein
MTERRAAGPERPSWLRRDSEAASPDGSEQAASRSEATLSSSGKVKAQEEATKHSKDKKRKKKKKRIKEKRHKEKRRKKDKE